MTKGALRRYQRKLEDLAFRNSLLASEVLSLRKQIEAHRHCPEIIQRLRDDLRKVRDQRDLLSDKVTILGRELRESREKKSPESSGSQ